MQDEIRAELATYLHSAQQSLLDLAADHGALSREIAAGIRDTLVLEDGAAEALIRNAARAQGWEHRADDLVNSARAMAQRGDKASFYCALVEGADDIADKLEDAAFHLSLLAGNPPQREISQPLGRLSTLVLEGIQEYLKALETARGLKRGAEREDMQDFLQAVHRIVGYEQESDRAHRAVKAALMAHAPDFHQLFALNECSRYLESAADALMHTGLSLHDHVLAEVFSE